MNKPTLILIHGAWHASWCFEKIIPLLQASGINVIAPDLPGHGRSKLPAHEVDLKKYVDAVIEVVKQQNAPVCLAGHSMGGIIITQVAELIPDYLAKLIYIAAYIPKNDESLLSMARHHAANGLNPHLIFDKTKSEIRLDEAKETPEFFYHLCSEDDKQRAVARWQPQPFQPFADTVTLSTRTAAIPKVSIIPRHDRAILPVDHEQMSQAVTDDINYIESDHSPFYSAAPQLCRLLEW